MAHPMTHFAFPMNGAQKTCRKVENEKSDETDVRMHTSSQELCAAMCIIGIMAGQKGKSMKDLIKHVVGYVMF